MVSLRGRSEVGSGASGEESRAAEVVVAVDSIFARDSFPVDAAAVLVSVARVRGSEHHVANIGDAIGGADGAGADGCPSSATVWLI